MARRSQKGESARTDAITVRLTPKLKYGLELQARMQHRTLAGTVEWAVERGLKDEVDGLVLKIPIANFDPECPELVNLKDTYMLDFLWDTEEALRVQKLASRMPDLLTYEEQKLWGFISENAYYWRIYPYQTELEENRDAKHMFQWWPHSRVDLIIQRVNQDLETLKDVIKNDKSPANCLPVWAPGFRNTSQWRFIKDPPEEVMSKLLVAPHEYPNPLSPAKRKERQNLYSQLVEELLKTESGAKLLPELKKFMYVRN